MNPELPEHGDIDQAVSGMIKSPLVNGAYSLPPQSVRVLPLRPGSGATRHISPVRRNTCSSPQLGRDVSPRRTPRAEDSAEFRSSIPFMPRSLAIVERMGDIDIFIVITRAGIAAR
jgi:hypothetical protein